MATKVQMKKTVADQSSVDKNKYDDICKKMKNKTFNFESSPVNAVKLSCNDIQDFLEDDDKLLGTQEFNEFENLNPKVKTVMIELEKAKNDLYVIIDGHHRCLAAYNTNNIENIFMNIDDDDMGIESPLLRLWEDVKIEEEYEEEEYEEEENKPIKKRRIEEF